MSDAFKSGFYGVVAVLLPVTAGHTGLGDELSLGGIQDIAVFLKGQVQANYAAAVAIFMVVYIVVNLWMPAAAVLTLLGGFLFGTAGAVVYVDTAATVGGCLAFWISSRFGGNWIQSRWRRQLVGFNRQIRRRGYAYLLVVRLIPMMPYMLVNFLAGLAAVPLRTFIWTTAVGSLPGILLLSYAGRQLLSIKSVEAVLTPRVIAAFVLLAAFVAAVEIARSRRARWADRV